MIARISGQGEREIGMELATRVYGKSDDLILIAGGEVAGEVDCYGMASGGRSVLLSFEDSTILEVRWGKAGAAIWEIILVRKGGQFDRIDACDDPEANLCSDVAYFRKSMKCCQVTFLDRWSQGLQVNLIPESVEG